MSLSFIALWLQTKKLQEIILAQNTFKSFI